MGENEKWRVKKKKEREKSKADPRVCEGAERKESNGSRREETDRKTG